MFINSVLIVTACCFVYMVASDNNGDLTCERHYKEKDIYSTKISTTVKNNEGAKRVYKLHRCISTKWNIFCDNFTSDVVYDCIVSTEQNIDHVVCDVKTNPIEIYIFKLTMNHTLVGKMKYGQQIGCKCYNEMYSRHTRVTTNAFERSAKLTLQEGLVTDLVRAVVRNNTIVEYEHFTDSDDVEKRMVLYNLNISSKYNITIESMSTCLDHYYNALVVDFNINKIKAPIVLNCSFNNSLLTILISGEVRGNEVVTVNNGIDIYPFKDLSGQLLNFNISEVDINKDTDFIIYYRFSKFEKSELSYFSCDQKEVKKASLSQPQTIITTIIVIVIIIFVIFILVVVIYFYRQRQLKDETYDKKYPSVILPRMKGNNIDVMTSGSNGRSLCNGNAVGFDDHIYEEIPRTYDQLNVSKTV